MHSPEFIPDKATATVSRPPRVAVSALLLAWLLTGCSDRQDNPVQADAPADPGRAAFESLALPANGSVGADPVDMAQALYGFAEPGEGRYTEETAILSVSPDRRVLLFTRLGLPDDSLRGQRYRLEFVPGADGWRLDWAGRQLTCWPGRGHEDWRTRFCN